jgi:hypothetical protein
MPNSRVSFNTLPRQGFRLGFLQHGGQGAHRQVSGGDRGDLEAHLAQAVPGFLGGGHFQGRGLEHQGDEQGLAGHLRRSRACLRRS